LDQSWIFWLKSPCLVFGFFKPCQDFWEFWGWFKHTLYIGSLLVGLWNPVGFQVGTGGSAACLDDHQLLKNWRSQVWCGRWSVRTLDSSNNIIRKWARTKNKRCVVVSKYVHLCIPDISVWDDWAQEEIIWGVRGKTAETFLKTAQSLLSRKGDQKSRNQRRITKNMERPALFWNHPSLNRRVWWIIPIHQ
jgi:hypothetical protein